MHTYNSTPEVPPICNCTVTELAEKLINMEVNTELNFSEGEDSSEYWGAKKLELFEQNIIIFGYYGGPAIQAYYPETDVLSDMIRHLEYHLNKKETDLIYLFDYEVPAKMKELQGNIVSSFFFYMWNTWYKEECKTVFGWEWEHFWSKWVHHTKETTSGAAEKFYADLCNNNRQKLVKRACEVYDGNRRKSFTNK